MELRDIMSFITSALNGQLTPSDKQVNDGVDTAASHLYDAECAFHYAHQTHVDAWVLAASDRLHAAITVHLDAVAASVACR